MADNVGIIAHQTPTRNSALTANLEVGLKSTPLALGSAAISEHISTVGIDVNNLRPWIMRDAQNFEKCEADTMLQELGLKDAEQAEQGSRVLYIIVFKKLFPITTLSGKEFLAAWWQVVKCHRALWKEGVFHRDVSLNNQMVYSLRGQFIGVLNGYDLSSLKLDGPSGLERTGTVPFMAIDLLSPVAIAGNVEHVYAHDAESFIWVLICVCLRYENGKLLSKNRPLEEWLKCDAIQCRVNKNNFVAVGLQDHHPSQSHKVSWDLVSNCLERIHSIYPPKSYRKLEDQPAFEFLLEGPMLEHDASLAAT